MRLKSTTRKKVNIIQRKVYASHRLEIASRARRQKLLTRVRERSYIPDMPGLVLDCHAIRSASSDQLAAHLIATNGPLLRLAHVWHLLGYPSADAARKAASRDSFPLELVQLTGRRGRFIRSTDLAEWLHAAQVTPTIRSITP